MGFRCTECCMGKTRVLYNYFAGSTSASTEIPIMNQIQIIAILTAHCTAIRSTRFCSETIYESIIIFITTT